MRVPVLIILWLASLAPLHVRANEIPKEEIIGLLNKGRKHLYDDPSQSLEISLQALNLSKTQNNDSLIIVSLNIIGTAHWSLGNNQQAMTYLQESLEKAKKHQYLQLMGNSLMNMGNIYNSAGLNFEAISYYKHAANLFQYLESKFRTFAVYNNIGRAFQQIDRFDSAHHYFRRAEVYLDSAFVQHHPIFYYNISESLFKQGEIQQADSILAIALQGAIFHNSKRSIIRINQLRSEILRLKRNFTDALQLAEETTKMALETKKKELIVLTTKTLAGCYSDIQDFDKAYQYEMLHERYLDTLQNIEMVNELELLSYNKRQFQLKKLESESAVNEQMANDRKMIINVLLIFLALIVILLAIIIVGISKLRRQKAELEKLNLFKSKIFATVSHDIKSPIFSFASLLELLNKKIIEKEDVESMLPKVSEMTKNLTFLLNEILAWAEGQMDGQRFTLTNFSLTGLFMELEDELQNKLTEKNISLVFNKSQSRPIYSDRGILHVVFRNLLINAIKFSYQNSKIDVMIRKNNEEHFVEITDYGVGIPDDKQVDIFKGALISTKGTSGEKGSGIGLTLSYDFVTNLGGTIEVESEEGLGTTFRVTLKKQASQQ